ncbi:hypothetical protein TNCV_2902251 [Trichonephila clavipes]|nr:hypothetical protein TNCV_2902251 [Trichonephila clavipes]
MQDGAPPHITRCVTDVLKHHFTEEHVISRHFAICGLPDRLTSIHAILALGSFKTAERVKTKSVEELKMVTPTQQQHCFEKWKIRILGKGCIDREGEYVEREYGEKVRFTQIF